MVALAVDPRLASLSPRSSGSLSFRSRDKLLLMKPWRFSVIRFRNLGLQSVVAAAAAAAVTCPTLALAMIFGGNDGARVIRLFGSSWTVLC